MEITQIYTEQLQNNTIVSILNVSKKTIWVEGWYLKPGYEKDIPLYKANIIKSMLGDDVEIITGGSYEINRAAVL